MVLPMVSASRKVNAPKSMENGINALWSLPTSILPIWGTIKPKKLIAPATAVEILASSTATREIVIRIVFTLTIDATPDYRSYFLFNPSYFTSNVSKRGMPTSGMPLPANFFYIIPSQLWGK